MTRAASSMRIAENKLDSARRQANRTRQICREAPSYFKNKKKTANNESANNESANNKSEPTNKTVEIKKDLYTYVGEGGCHNDNGKAQQDCRLDPNCNFIGQQSNGCWHKLKQDNNGISKKSSYPRGFYEVK